jgi:hypothetical protein
VRENGRGMSFDMVVTLLVSIVFDTATLLMLPRAWPF